MRMHLLEEVREAFVGHVGRIPEPSPAGQRQHRPHLLRAARLNQGQSILEYAVLVGAVTSALILMSEYVRNAFNAHANAIEQELSGAVDENKPN